MLTEFEDRLADVLGAVLDAPFAGRVRTASGALAGAGPAITLAVTGAAPIAESFNTGRQERPAALDRFRRVARLRCTLALDVAAAAGEGHAQRLAGVDQVLYLFTRPDLLSGRALDEPGIDQGFWIEGMALEAVVMPAESGQADLTISARGLFWPAGIVGEAGVVIDEVRIRAAIQPVVLAEPLPRLVAGGPATPLRLALATAGRMDLHQDGPPTTAPLDRVTARLIGKGGGPGAGVLGGGVAGPAGSRVLALVAGAAEVAYTPPAAGALDHLVLALERDGSPGLELGRFALRTVPA